MTNQHPIIPPPDLVDKWHDQWMNAWVSARYIRANQWIANQSAQWGADQELEACCEWLQHNYPDGTQVAALWATRRPNPPSLKEQALEQLDGIATCFRATHMGDIVCDKIRKALEALPND